MSKEYNKFKKEFEKAAKEALVTQEQIVRAAAIDVLSGIIKDTVVGDPRYWKIPVKGYTGGSLRGNWQCSLSAPKSGTTTRKQKGAKGSATQEMLSTTANYKLTDTIYFVNNLPYAELINDGRVEIKTGSYQSHFVERNTERFDKIVKALEKRHNK